MDNDQSDAQHAQLWALLQPLYRAAGLPDPEELECSNAECPGARRTYPSALWLPLPVGVRTEYDVICRIQDSLVSNWKVSGVSEQMVKLASQRLKPFTTNQGHLAAFPAAWQCECGAIWCSLCEGRHGFWSWLRAGGVFFCRACKRQPAPYRRVLLVANNPGAFFVGCTSSSDYQGAWAREYVSRFESPVFPPKCCMCLSTSGLTYAPVTQSREGQRETAHLTLNLPLCSTHMSAVPLFDLDSYSQCVIIPATVPGGQTTLCLVHFDFLRETIEMNRQRVFASAIFDILRKVPEI